MVKFFRWPFWWPFWWPFCVVNLRAVGTFRVAVLVVNFPDLLGLYGSPNWGLFSRVVVAVGVAVPVVAVWVALPLARFSGGLGRGVSGALLVWFA